MCCRRVHRCRRTRACLPRVFLRLCRCLDRVVVRPNALEPRTASIGMSSRAVTVLLHHCARAANQALDLKRVATVLQKFVLEGSGSVHSVVICDEVFVPHLRFANSTTPASCCCGLSSIHWLDHLSSVCPSFAGVVGHVTVELASVPVQQPRSVRGDSSFHQTARNLSCTHVG